MNVGGLAVALLVLGAIVSSRSPFFLTQGNLLNIGRAVAVTGIIAAVTTLVLVAGELDLSVGAALGVGGIAGGVALAAGASVPVALLATVGTGVAIGLANALLIVGLGLNPLIATLGTLFAVRGVGFIWTGGVAVRTFGRQDFTEIVQAKVAGIPVTVIFLLATFVVVGVILTLTVFGSHLYSIGGNRDAARLAGVPVAGVRLAVYVSSGVAAAFAGLMLAGINGSADPVSGQGIELLVIGAVILGGTSLGGGKGGVLGTVLGVLFLGALANGMNLMGLPAYWQIFIQGLVLIAAITIDRLVARR